MKKKVIIIAIPIILTIVGFISDSLNLFERFKHTFCAKEIHVGILNTLNTNDYHDKLVSRYIIPANERLSENNLNYKCTLINVDYEGMFNDLESGKIDLAFSSPYTYLAYKYKKFNKENDLDVKALRRQINSGRIYYSYLIYNKNTKNVVKESTIKDLYEKSKMEIFLGDQWSSTSTSVIPKIYFWEKGIILNAFTKSRSEILEKIRKAKDTECIIGFLSSSDYNSLSIDEQNEIGVLKINITIPSDPILINDDVFNKKFGQDSEKILNAISSINKMTAQTEEWSYPEFEKYVASGVVYSIDENEIKVIFHNNLNDIYNINHQLKKNIDSAITFIRFSQPNGVQYFVDLDSRIIGEGEIVKDLLNARFIANSDNIENIKIGDHVLLSNTNKSR